MVYILLIFLHGGGYSTTNTVTAVEMSGSIACLQAKAQIDEHAGKLGVIGTLCISKSAVLAK